MITPLPGVTTLVPGSCTLPFPGIQAAVVDETGKDVPWGQGGILVVKQALAEHDPHHLGRPRALQEELLPGRLQGQVLPGGRRRDPRRQDRLLHHHRPHRRRAERVGPPHGHDGDRVGAGVAPDWWPKPPWWAARRHHRRGHLRLRGAQAPAPDRRRGQEDRQRTAQLGGQGDRPDRQAQGHPLRRQPAQDPLGQDHAPPAALDRQGRRRSPRTPARWRTRRSWIRRCDTFTVSAP
jgi:hypothetical protein